jgi:hypothetical protein
MATFHTNKLPTENLSVGQLDVNATASYGSAQDHWLYHPHRLSGAQVTICMNFRSCPFTIGEKSKAALNIPTRVGEPVDRGKPLCLKCPDSVTNAAALTPPETSVFALYRSSS